MSSYDIVFFDIGGVLLPNTTPLIDELAREFHRDGEDLRLFWKPLKRLAYCGQIDESDAWNRLVEHERLPDTGAYLLNRVIEEYTVELDGARDVVRGILRSVGRLGIISNVSRLRADEIWKRIDFMSSFSEVILSCDCRMSKPELAIFQLAITQAKVEAARCLFLDDKESNVTAARSIGMTALTVRSLPELQRDLLSMGLLT